jgi:hypothetical protein
MYFIKLSQSLRAILYQFKEKSIDSTKNSATTIRKILLFRLQKRKYITINAKFEKQQYLVNKNCCYLSYFVLQLDLYFWKKEATYILKGLSYKLHNICTFNYLFAFIYHYYSILN